MYWYEQEVRHVESKYVQKGRNAEVIFYGSSSIRGWDSLEADFPGIDVANLGFGGSTLAACVWFFDRMMTGFEPKALVVYAGDNDLGDGRHPEEVLIFFQQLMVKSKARFAHVPCFFVSLKPSPARWHIAEQFRYANNLIESEIIKCDDNWKFIDIFKEMLDKSGKPIPHLYSTDGLHLAPAGYQLWQQIISKALTNIPVIG